MRVIKKIQLTAIVLFFMLLVTACPFWDVEGEIKIVNDSAGDPITSVNIDSGCSNGWSNEHTTNIPYNESRTFKVDSGDYDVRACKQTDLGTLCAIWYDEFVDMDETVTFEYSYREDYTTTKESSC